ncbi:MAG: 2-hydroxyglutaryl-CoA dehydratase [Bacteroidales bacterium]|nr:2-hydroxyglutaryl-CoA dehydratase [Bacteroidales bacterium]
MKNIRVGLDIGSTTLKAIAIDDSAKPLFTYYERHNADVLGRMEHCFGQLRQKLGEEVQYSICLTGSVAMGVAEREGLDFVQEVVAAAEYVKRCHPEVSTMIDIGGEDAKIVLFEQGKAKDLRMNGNCAGGTGAFIDQMAVLLDVDVAALDALAREATQTYAIASRCGVFCKTDIQNLIAKNAAKSDIAASIFRAVTVQTVSTLAHGCELRAPMMLVGGPLTFIPSLRKSFIDFLHLSESDIILPEEGALIPAWGAALRAKKNGLPQPPPEEGALPIADELTKKNCRPLRGTSGVQCNETERRGSECSQGHLEKIFTSKSDYDAWRTKADSCAMRAAVWKHDDEQTIYIGIDSGSTTTKIVALTPERELLYTYYRVNRGNPIATVVEGLRRLDGEAQARGVRLRVAGCCTTGYGEDLIKAAMRAEHGIIETMAHYMAAAYLTPDVSFILDIGGQDMKAIFVDQGIINRIEINEACSSGCGSFIAAFAQSLGYTLEHFAHEACIAGHPCDLGTRCTVFMNSKVKQKLREGATVADIAAGLSYSVVKNCLFKVLRLTDTAVLGDHIVVQGGTMKNDSVVRAFELLTGKSVLRSNTPELMGAVGCALYAIAHASVTTQWLDELLDTCTYTTRQAQCHGCENQCLIQRYTFANGARYVSGNRCERIYTNGATAVENGRNAYEEKRRCLFGELGIRSEELGVNSQLSTHNSQLKIGLPRCLNIFEEYPFWNALFTACGMEVVLSSPSDYGRYERVARQIMSDNICFPAKLAHAHVQELVDRRVDRVFMPFVVYERSRGEQNSYNCPVVTGYSQVIKSVQTTDVPIDAPVFSFKDEKTLYRQCRRYLLELGVDESCIRSAFAEAIKAQEDYEHEVVEINRRIYAEALELGRPVILLAGRPYHTDPLIQHQLSDVAASLGAYVITEDIARELDVPMGETHILAQWSFPNRIVRAAKWAVEQPVDILFMQITSFGCGPDAFFLDEIATFLARHGKALTLIKVDDVNNVGSLKLRIRSALQSRERVAPSTPPEGELNAAMSESPLFGRGLGEASPFTTTRRFTKDERHRKVLAPFFTPFISPLLPKLFGLAGYDVDILPVSDKVSDEWGLKYANNEVCYPATLVIGDIVKAFKEHRYDPKNTAVAMSQTGGQCRASNYVPMIKSALVQMGLEEVPVISFAMTDSIQNDQPGFTIPWAKVIRVAIAAVLCSDAIAKMYYAAVVRETRQGEAARLRDHYIALLGKAVEHNNPDRLYATLGEAARDFDAICQDKHCPKVGVVGEILLKFHPYAQRGVTDWLVERGIEVLPPLMTEFFLETFVNKEARREALIDTSTVSPILYKWAYSYLRRQMRRADKLCAPFRYYQPFHDIFDIAREASHVINLNTQFGEGWLLPAEVIGAVRSGATHVVSLQPFGCIANHIVCRGVENKLKRYLPELNLLSLDFDSNVSEVNVVNRLLLFVEDL